MMFLRIGTKSGEWDKSQIKVFLLCCGGCGLVFLYYAILWWGM